jgi:hypothetical protein
MGMISRLAIAILLTFTGACANNRGDARKADVTSSNGWRSIPLVKGGQIDPAWKHTGWGTFVVEDGVLRTECDERGLGLLVYTNEKLGDCQVRVVYRAKEARSNSGVYIRIDDGILKRLDEKAPAAKRDASGSLTPEGAKAMEEGSDKELGPWYAVHHGYEVQIADGGDEFHRTGAIYSYARAEAAPQKPRDQWREMLITLKGTHVSVDLDGKRVTEFDSTDTNVPPRKAWHEPRREPTRPTRGYFGLQNHDPGDVVWFKEVSVRPLK